MPITGIRSLALVALAAVAALPNPSGPKPIRVLVWSEGTAPKDVYPDDIRGQIAKFLGTGEWAPRFAVKTATLTDPDQGLSDNALDSTDVLVWWGHVKHDQVADAAVARIVSRVKGGTLGFLALHSAHYSKPFKALVGAPADLGGWREDGKPEHLTVAAPDHPVAAGLPKEFTIEHEEMYNEPFKIREPETVVFRSRWDTGETFRSGCAFKVGDGRVFYFRPGHESFPTYFDPNVERVIVNAIQWLAPPSRTAALGAPLPKYSIVSAYSATVRGDAWDVAHVAARAFSFTVLPGADPGLVSEDALPVETILSRIGVCPGVPEITLADQAKRPGKPFQSGALRFNRAGGTIAEAYDELYEGAPRLRRMSVPIYADVARIKAAEGRYIEWPKCFERLAPEAGSMKEYPDATDGPERRWRAYTEDNPHPLLRNFEYGLALRERWIDGALVTEYHLSGPRSAWVQSFRGVDALTPLETPGQKPAYLMTTVLDIDIEFNSGNPGDSRVFDSMEKQLASLKARAEAGTQ